MNYQYQRGCECGNIDSLEVSKIEAAFELNYLSFSKSECSKCGEKKMSFGSINSPEIDRELLTIWAENIDYLFCPLDEGLTLAQYKENIDLYLEFIDDEIINAEKKNVLIEALCVMIYDRVDKTDKEDLDIINKIATELKLRENQVLFSQHWIMDYIKKVSFPIIGVEYKNSLSSKVDKENHKDYLESIIKESIDKRNSKNKLWAKIKNIWK
ncbi:hypothetical protein CJ739_2677 [Mariniflexile rhizosphaerae]|uniref:hypothetical protein n=1 Tax=unclassified Mariniflexile TaxID=2643887 RepID=UPI000CBE855E|nr:hypothetical protein [Mariniflexile sp. TRM1-10]AXP81749.1 hypothetical protein CJ739_2677 [Mariniflexile sp. TRM1-10]PLB20870.1 MAG: hypothetical protein TRG1_438 [Flavobacteriaceae bacterium FS1-H7996/R]